MLLLDQPGGSYHQKTS